jgi:hypothetical protein
VQPKSYYRCITQSTNNPRTSRLQSLGCRLGPTNTVLRGMDIDSAAAWAANSEVESRGDYRKKQDNGGPGFGFFQWGTNDEAIDRRRTFERVMKVPIQGSTEDQQLYFRDWELQHTHGKAKEAIEKAQGPAAKAAAIWSQYEGARKNKGVNDRMAIAEVIAQRAAADAAAARRRTAEAEQLRRTGRR